MMTVKESLFKKSNDYSSIQKEFEEKTGLEFIGREIPNCDPDKIEETISIVIPAYMGHRTLPITLQSLERQVYRNFEVVIVDDASPESLREIVTQSTFSYPIKFIRHDKNRGRPSARNTGIALADGQTIVLMDQDMVPTETHVLNFAVRQHYSRQCTFIGFKENIDYAEWVTKWQLGIRPSIQADWRYKKTVNENYIGLNLNGKRVSLQGDVYILKTSDYLKKLDYGESIAYWDLPWMVISHSACFKKETAVIAGGFPEIFKGWGVEDIAFGASLIAHGQYVVPVLNCVSYHINHERLSGSLEKQWEEFRGNLRVYFKWVDTPLQDLKFPSRSVRSNGKIGSIEFYETIVC
jgi:glycosyltransferase involved in cell wall biosynthesis